MSEANSITVLLHKWRKGDLEVMDKLGSLVHQELHRIANRYMWRERNPHTLQPTALVNEAFLKLMASDVDWLDRQHFYAVAARQMRHILVDYARARERQKRGGEFSRVDFNENAIAGNTETGILDITDALRRLKQFDEKKHDMLELYYFAGLSMQEIANCYGKSTKTIQRELRMAEAWLRAILFSNDHDS